MQPRRAYYNENDPRAAAWLRELIAAGLIAPGDVDDRSIADVQPKDLRGYSQCHFFAGIGGWSYALRLAGWPDDAPVWTGSCPCQPFSAAGKHRADADERHLWPEFYRLISECRPAVCCGEQVASELGLQWLAGVFADLERCGYAVAGADLCAASVGAPHIRQRLYWVGVSDRERLEAGPGLSEPRREGRSDGAGETRRVADLSSGGLGEYGGTPGSTGHADFRGEVGAWSDSILIPCGDGKSRRIESGSFPLVDGFPERVGLLRGYGNAIVPQVAAQFIEAVMEVA